MTQSSNYAQPGYGSIAYGVRGPAVFPFSTGESLIAGDISVYTTVSPINVMAAGSETRQQAAPQEKRQYSVTDNRNFTS